MTATNQFLVGHGLPLLFAAVFLEQLGLPLPAVPWLMAAGALAAAGKLSLPLGLGVTVVACVVADALWFYLGRYRGNQMLGLLCRMSLEPDSCVRRTQNAFTKYGVQGLLIAKFVPGMGLMAPPLAGMFGVGVDRFLVVDALGSLLYGACFLALGYSFSNQIEQLVAALGRVGGGTLSLLAGVAALYVLYKYWQRRRLLRELRMARITVDELRRKLEAGEDIVILDLRSKAAVEQDPYLIQGAIHLGMEELDSRQHEIPRDREVVLYCSCPNEVSSARAALRLHRRGYTRVRPLLGGIDAWREQNYPVQPRPPTEARASLPGPRGTASGTPRPAASPVLVPDQSPPNPAKEGQTP
jgi:membrane protein DedA with SNARE-associated domain/rhodanese-related sulfurtransferase